MEMNKDETGQSAINQKNYVDSLYDLKYQLLDLLCSQPIREIVHQYLFDDQSDTPKNLNFHLELLSNSFYLTQNDNSSDLLRPTQISLINKKYCGKILEMLY